MGKLADRLEPLLARATSRTGPPDRQTREIGRRWNSPRVVTDARFVCEGTTPVGLRIRPGTDVSQHPLAVARSVVGVNRPAGFLTA